MNTRLSSSREQIALGSSGNFLLIEAPDAGEKHLYVKGKTLNGKLCTERGFAIMK